MFIINMTEGGILKWSWAAANPWMKSNNWKCGSSLTVYVSLNFRSTYFQSVDAYKSILLIDSAKQRSVKRSSESLFEMKIPKMILGRESEAIKKNTSSTRVIFVFAQAEAPRPPSSSKP